MVARFQVLLLISLDRRTLPLWFSSSVGYRGTVKYENYRQGPIVKLTLSPILSSSGLLSTTSAPVSVTSSCVV